MRLIVRQSSKKRSVDVVFLKRVVRTLLKDLLQQPVTELGIYVVDTPEMTRLNEEFLQHRGSTDVITFDYTEGARTGALAGEVFVCLDVALRQAPRFKADWQTEVVRYVVHGILHLQGYDDRRQANRVRMKKEENRLVRRLAKRFSLAGLAKSNSARLNTTAPNQAYQK